MKGGVNGKNNSLACYIDWSNFGFGGCGLRKSQRHVGNVGNRIVYTCNWSHKANEKLRKQKEINSLNYFLFFIFLEMYK